MIAEKTGDGQALVDFAWSVLSDQTRAHSERWDALQWFSGYYYGKPVQQMDIQTNATGPLVVIAAELTEHDLERQEQLLSEMMVAGEVIDVGGDGGNSAPPSGVAE